jgi:hypothetical protein
MALIDSIKILRKWPLENIYIGTQNNSLKKLIINSAKYGWVYRLVRLITPETGKPRPSVEILTCRYTNKFRILIIYSANMAEYTG